MPFPSHNDREEQYRTGGLILAQTARGIGLPVDTTTELAWADTLARLTTADEASEQDPDGLTPRGVLTALDLDPNNDDLLDTTARLIDANIHSHKAATLLGHFVSKGMEAHHCSELLRHQSPTPIRYHSQAWRQLSAVSVAGMYVDSFLDAREDAVQFPQFSARQLAFGALWHLGVISSDIQPRTWRSLLRATHEYGLDGHIARKPARLLLRKTVLRTQAQ